MKENKTGIELQKIIDDNQSYLEFIKVVVLLSKKYPNDFDFGKEVRHFINESISEELDDNTNQ